MQFPQRILLAFLLLTGSTLIAQQASGDHPNKQNWQKLTSPAVEVIFPKGFEFKANKVANLINYLQENNTRSIGSKSKQLTVVLQNKTVESNGFVGFFPFRSEFYSLPPQRFSLLGSMDFTTLLSIHEYRHALQFYNGKKGLTKLGYLLQGENGWAFFQNLAVPNWYLEGDAVVQETALTESGRGRNANFTAFQRSIAQANVRYPYSKIRNGSFKDLVPDHYRWGYTMLSHLRNEHGNDISGKIMQDAAAYKKVFYPFSRSMKKHTGLTTKQLYKESWEASKAAWNKQLEGRIISESKSLTASQLKKITQYHFPQFDSEGNLYVWKSSIDDIDQIIKIENKQEIKILRPGITYDSYFHLNNSHLVWTEASLNPRRNNESYHNIIVYDLLQKQRKQISKKGRYFSPNFYPDGKKLFAVFITEQIKASLVEMDLEGKNEKVLLEFAEGEFVARPKYIQEEEAFVYLLQSANTLALWKYDTKTKQKTQLSPATKHIMDAPFVQGNFVYFSADFDQIDNIYRVPLDGSMKLEKMSSSSIGAYEPTLNPEGNQLVFKEVIFNGEKLVQLDLNKALKESHEIIEPIHQNWGDRVAAEAEGGSIISKLSDTTYPTENYNGLLRGMKLYSWPITGSNSTSSLTLNFTNYLSEISAAARAGYNFNENGAYYSGAISYAKYFPVFTLSAGRSFRTSTYLDEERYRLSDQQFTQNQVQVEISVPLRWFQGNYIGKWNPQASFVYYDINKRSIPYQNLPDKNYQLLSSGFTFSFVKRNTRQQLASRLGIAIDITYSRNARILSDEKFTSSARAYLPGLFKTHSLQISGGFQKEPLSNDFQLADAFEYPRGFNTPINDEFKKISLEYAFPLSYPDWGIWGITYFKRIKTNFFTDYGIGRLSRFNYSTTYHSVGGELIFDCVLANTLPVSIGFRGSALITEDPLSPNAKFTTGIFIGAGF